jgi:hypothetical protein
MEDFALTNPERRTFFAFPLKLPANFSGEQDVQTISSTAQDAHLQSQGTSGGGVESAPVRALPSRSGSFQRQPS